MSIRIKNILIADDKAASLEMLKIVLTEKGFNIRTAHSGEVAEKLICTHNFDLLVLDNQLKSGPLGIELCAKYSDKVPVLMLSGDDIEEAALAAGAIAFIPRPVTPSQLLSVIHMFELRS